MSSFLKYSVSSFLKKVIDEKKRRWEQERRQKLEDLGEIENFFRSGEGVKKPASRDFFRALCDDGTVKIIAEVKRASPSAGLIKQADAVEQALKYQSGGADAISVLTENTYFGGSLEDLRNVSEVVSIPVLRKDFIIFPAEIRETWISGADSYLLISEAIENLDEMIDMGRKLGLEPLVECFSYDGMEKIIGTSAKIIGINSRNLHTLDVDLARAMEIFLHFKKHLEGKIIVVESGIKNESDIKQFVDLGITRFLIGETLMRAEDVSSLMARLKIKN